MRRFSSFQCAWLAAALVGLAGCGGGGSVGGAGGSGGSVPTARAPVMACDAGQTLAAMSGTQDPLFFAAWHLQNTGPGQEVSALTNTNAVAGVDARVQCVHNNGAGFTGRGVTIAIVDSALETSHEDLAANVSDTATARSFNFDTGSSNVNPPAAMTKLDHGTGVAGVAAAAGWNGRGSRGTAPAASLVGYNTVVDGARTLFGGGTDEQMNVLALGGGSDPVFQAGNVNAMVSTFGNRANGVGVFNMSFGADVGSPPPTPTTLGSAVRAAQWGTANLRSGRGAVYLQSAGNSFQGDNAFGIEGQADRSITCANVFGRTGVDDGVIGTITNRGNLTCGSPNQDANNTTSPYIYIVASINNTGVASSYSSAGANVWVTGFGGEFGNGQNGAAIISTDNSGCSSGANSTVAAVYNAFVNALPQGVADLVRFVAESFGLGTRDPSCNYTGQMNGTSAAAPSVSGVVALMLEANPNLSWQDVGYILAKTARRVDAGHAAVDIDLPGATPSSYRLVDPWVTNAAGYNFHNRYGFGLVDAAAAVAMARNHTAPAGRRTAAVEGTFTSTVANMNTAVFNDTGVRRNDVTVAVGTAAQRTGAVTLDVTVTNLDTASLNPGQLQFELVSPAGTKSILLPAYTVWYAGADGAAGSAPAIPANGTRSFRFTTNAFFGENLGSFVVRVANLKPNGGNISLSGGKLTSHSL